MDMIQALNRIEELDKLIAELHQIRATVNGVEDNYLQEKLRLLEIVGGEYEIST